MRKLRLILPMLVIALALAEPATANDRVFVAHLTGDQEVPANDSQAQGQAVLMLSKDGSELRYRLIVANIQNVSQAHIRVGPPDDNGPWCYDYTRPLRPPS